jgi:hypothetical protein
MQRDGHAPAVAMRWNSRAVALGLYDFGGVLRQCYAALQMFLGDHREDVFELGQGCVTS